MRRLANRTSPSMLVALAALFVALGGTSIAASKLINGASIKKSSIPGDRLKKGSVKGDRLAKGSITQTQINMAKLGTVPNAANAANATNAANAANATNAANAANATNATKADSAKAVDQLRFVDAPIAGDGTAVLAQSGSISVVGECVLEVANRKAYVEVRSTKDGASYAGDDDKQVAFGPATPQANRRPENPGSDSAGAAAISDGYDDALSVRGADGEIITGQITSIADKNGGSCRFFGSVAVK